MEQCMNNALVMELPYYRELHAIRNVLEKEEQKQGTDARHPFEGPCVDFSRLVSRFIPELIRQGGLYLPLLHGHAFNYDSERGLYVDISMDQFRHDLESKFRTDKECKACDVFFETNPDDPDKRYSLSENENIRKRNWRGHPVLCGVEIKNAGQQKDFSVYESIDDIPYLPIPSIVVLPQDNPLLREYPLLTEAVRNTNLDLDHLVSAVKEELKLVA